MNIPIFLSSDNNYAPLVATTMASILSNTKSFIEFYILDGGITSENVEKILSLKNNFNNFSIEFIKIDYDKYLKEFNATGHWSKSTFSRLLIPNLKPNINKAIYLDVDIIATGDIIELYNEQLDDYIIGAIWQETEEGYWNQHRKEYLKSSSSHKYFNAGVLLIDCAQWRNNNLFEKLLDIQFEYGEKIKCVDQDLLNKYFDNNYKILPRKYNYLTDNFIYFPNDTDIIIRHMVGRIRPWQINENTKTNLMPNLKEFWHYAKMTPFYEEVDAKTHDKQKETDLLRNMQIDLMTWKLYAHHTRVKLEREKSHA